MSLCKSKEKEIKMETKEKVKVASPKNLAKKDNYLAIYKANKNTTGAALQLRLHRDFECAFFEAALQIDDMDSSNPYDWGKKIVVKLGESDIGKLLSLLEDKVDSLKLFHQNEKGSKIVEVKKQTGNYKGYFMTISASMKETVDKDGNKVPAKNTRVSLPIGDDEAELMKLALKTAYNRILGW